MVVILTNSIELSSTINVFTKINVVDLINVTFIHVTAEDFLSEVLSHSNFHKIKNTEELELGNMTVLGAIKVLELWLKVNASVLDCPLEFLKNT